MPNLTIPDPESMLGERNNVRLYAKDANETEPLYRAVKLMSTTPLFDNRRTAHLTWVVHEQRFVRGGDSWRIEKSDKSLFEWAAAECAKEFDMAYVKDTFDLTDAQIAKLIALK